MYLCNLWGCCGSWNLGFHLVSGFLPGHSYIFHNNLSSEPIRSNIHHFPTWSVCARKFVQTYSIHNYFWVPGLNAWGVETFGQNNIYILVISVVQNKYNSQLFSCDIMVKIFFYHRFWPRKLIFDLTEMI